ncbi:MAG: Ig-like domain-containing protein [Thomasclavelia sp.]
MQGLVKVTKKLGTSFLAMCLILAMMPVNVFAEGETSGGITKLEITASDDVKKSSNGTNYFVIGSNKENSFKLSVKQTPGTASDEVTWSSNQESKGITIDENGIVKVDYKETTATYPTFTATSKENESVQAKYSLYILPEMSLSTSDSIEFTLPEDGTLLKENDKYFKVKPDQYETYGVIEWTSENTDVATVKSNGTVCFVTAAKPGVTKVIGTNKENKDKELKMLLYLDNLELTNYSSFNEWKSTTSEFESSKFDYTLTTKSANNGTFNANFRPTFDDTKYKVEIFNNDKLVKTVEKSKTSQAVALEPGANKVVIRISDLTNEKNYTDYKFDITRTRSTTATLSVGGATIVPSERALISNPTYKGRSEGTFFRLENGELTKVAGISPTISDYKAFLYKDINSFDLNISPKDSWSIVRASIDDGESVNVEKGKPIKNIKFGDKNSVKIKIQICSNSKYYANKEAGKEDPFEAENTYTITVERLSVDKSELQITSADISSGQWCTPEFNKDIVTAAILIPKDCNSLDINFKVTNGATVYKDSKSDANLLNAEEDGNYKLTIDTSKITSSLTQRIVLYKVLEDGSEMITTYTFTIYKRGKLVGMPDKVVDYFCPGSQYSNMGNYGLYPEKSLIGSGNWYTPISLGNFGGSITYYYENGIKNDPTNPYGIDFTIFGNSNGGQSFSEPGNVIVSKDRVNWYTLAGSEHYDDKAIWGYELTYIRNGNGTACSYKDSLGKSDDMTAMYKYALKENYPLHKFDADADKQVTVKGTLLVNDSKDPYGSRCLRRYPDFGYVDVHTNSSTVAGTGENVDLLTVPVGNPYAGNYNKYGDGFDLDWAVDEDSTYIPQELIEEFGGRIYIIPPYQHLFSYMKTLIKLFKTNKYSIVHSHINSLSIFPLCAAQIAKVKIRIAHSHSSSGNNEFKRNIIKYILRPFSKVFPNCFFACSNFAGRWLFGKKFMDSGKNYNIKQCN